MQQNTSQLSEQIKDYNGRDYRTVWQKPHAAFEDRFEGGLTKRLLTDAPGWFIDIGGGYGRVYPLYKREGRKSVIVDYAMNLLEMAATSHGKDKDAYFVAANAYHMPFKDAVFSGGVSIRTLHHMNKPETFLNECGRITRAGGRVCMEYANKGNIARLFKRGFRALKKDHEHYGDMHFGTHPDYYATLAHDAGFTVERNLGTGFMPRYIKYGFPIGVLAFKERMLDAFFGPRRLAPLMFTDLKKRKGEKDESPVGDTLLDILACPACRGILEPIAQGLHCTSCKRIYPKVGMVYDLRYTP